MRIATPIAAFLVATAVGSSAARADEVSPETRAAVERAFLEGRMADLPALVPSPSGDADPFTASMFGWRDGTGTHTLPEPPRMRLPSHDFALAAAPYPLVLAFLQDRDEREVHVSMDAQAKPTNAEATFAALPDPDGRIRWLRDLQRSVQEPARDTESPDPVRAQAARERAAKARDLVGLATVWAWAALAGLVLLTVLAGVLVRPRPSGS